MPDYPIDYIVTFAVNGVMVLVVFICLAQPKLASHAVKINLSIFISGFLTLIMPPAIKLCPGQASAFSVTVALMFFIGVTQALALAQTLSYMSFMPERYMALNSMGIGFSGLISLGINTLLLVCFDESAEFARVMTSYTLCFLLMAGISAMYFVECKSDFA